MIGETMQTGLTTFRSRRLFLMLLVAIATLVGPSTLPGTQASGQEQIVPPFTRSLYLRFPRMQGGDVRRVQQRLLDIGYRQVGGVDSIFGPKADAAVRAFQS